MFDIVNFKPKEEEYRGIELIYNRELEKGIFVSTNDSQKARGFVKRVRYFHYSDYEADQGLVQMMKENGCTLVVALADFFGVGYEQKARRLSRAKNLIKIANKTGVQVRIFSLARDEYELRDGFEIFWIGKLLGVKQGQIKAYEEERL